MSSTVRHLLEVDDLTPAELVEVLDLCERPDHPQPLAGQGAALIFEKQSTRTRHSTEMAVVQLGGHPITVRADEIGIDTRETAEDVARTLACYHAVICARVYEHHKLERMAAVAGIPVVNLLSDDSHPLQAITDLLTIRQEFGRLDGLTVAWVGDWSNVARSLAIGAAMSGMHVRVAAPHGYGPSEAETERLVVLGAASVEVGDRPADLVKGADVVTTDAWYAMGQEAEAAVRRQAFEGFTVDADLLAAAGERSVLLHCLPAHRGEEVAGDALDGPHSRIWTQAANRMHAARGVLAWLLAQ
jgi:ornithine carbamoyltransferase